MKDAGGRWVLALRLARRDFSWRFTGLRLLIVCLFLGAAALSAIGTLEGAIRGDLAKRGQQILGGDIELSVYSRRASDAELSAMHALGTVSEGMRMQAMAVSGNGSEAQAAPIQLKAVDARYPLYGSLRLTDGRTVGAPSDGLAWVDRGMLDRLGLRPGDRFGLGDTSVRIAGVIADEPDRLSEGLALGPPVIVSLETLGRAGLLQNGSMTRSKYRLAFTRPIDPHDAIKGFERRFPSGGWSARARDRASPAADRLMANMGEFLSLVGLSALVIAGLGIAGAVASWLETRRSTIATLKMLGADNTDVLRVHLLQVLAASCVGIGAGLVAGYAVVPALAAALADLVPVEARLAFDGAALGRAALFAGLVAVVFAAPPLIATQSVPPMALLRVTVAPPGALWRRATLPVGLGIGAIVAFALAGSPQKGLTAGFIAGTALILALLAGIGLLIKHWAARVAGNGLGPALRTALSALHRPGAQTAALVTALGTSLAAFAAIAVIQTSLDAAITRAVPRLAPDFFVIDLPLDGAAPLSRLVEAEAPGAKVRTVPAMRGSILAFGPEKAMTRVDEMAAIPEEAWALRGERTLTYSADLPDGNVVVAGRWWSPDGEPEPLVSIDADLADVLGLKIGDMLTIGLLGVERRARIASFRRIDWSDMGFNHALIFAPGAIDDAPHTLSASIALPDGINGGPLLTSLIRQFPTSSVIETGSVLQEARTILDQLAGAILAAAGITVFAGMAVLVGAIAAARSRETYDTVILRVLGASRAQVLKALAARYTLLATLLGAIALMIGTVVGLFVVEHLFEMDFRPDWLIVSAVVVTGAALVIGVALTASLPLLRARPAAAMRAL